MATSKIQAGAGRVLLWENPNPTASFDPQTILSTDLSEYAYIEVWAMLYTGFQHLIPVVHVPIGMQGNLTGVAGHAGETSGVLVVVTRGITFNSNSIYASEGMGCSASSSWTINNGNAIPYKIYGIK